VRLGVYLLTGASIFQGSRTTRKKSSWFHLFLMYFPQPYAIPIFHAASTMKTPLVAHATYFITWRVGLRVRRRVAVGGGDSLHSCLGCVRSERVH
jgi:hypothetical protein